MKSILPRLNFRRLPLRLKLIAAFLGFTIISVGIISIQSIGTNSRILTANIGVQANQIAESNASAFGNELNRLVNVLSSLSFSVSLQSDINNANNTYPTDPKDISKTINDLTREWEETFDSNRNSNLLYDRLTNKAANELRGVSYRITGLGYLFVTDRYGALVATLAPVRNYDFSKDTWWEQVFNKGDGGIYISLPTYDDILQKTVVLIAVPVFDRVGNYFIGSVATKVPIDSIVDRLLLESKTLGENANMNLVFPGSPPLMLEPSEAETCSSKESEPVGFQVGNDAIIVVTGKSNTFLDDISEYELKRILNTTGLWSEINPIWPGESIQRYWLVASSETLDFLANKGLFLSPESDDHLHFLNPVSSPNKLIDKIIANPYAIGFITSAQYSDNAGALKVVSVDGTLPAQQTVESGRYKLAKPLMIYSSVKNMRRSPEIAAFIQYWIETAGEAAKAVGYYAPSQESLQQARISWLGAMGFTEFPEINPAEYTAEIRFTSSSEVNNLVTEIKERFQKDGFSGLISISNIDQSFGIEQLCTQEGTDIAFIGRDAHLHPHLSGKKYLTETLELGSSSLFFMQTLNSTDELVSVASVKDEQSSLFIQDLGWMVVVHNPLEDALTPVESQKRTSLAILLVIAGLATVGAIGFSQVLAGPIQRLSETAQKFGGGDLETRAIVETDDEIGHLATTFNDMAGRIYQSMEFLENQVEERTRAVVTSAEISRRLSRILDQRQLVLAVVEEIQNSFKFYHVQIYLFDQNQANLVMVGGTGEAGKIMMERGHHIEIGRGLVGRSAKANESIVVSNTLRDFTWVPNILLPDTRSEAAIPITAGEQVLGVLDVQHNIESGINLQTVDLLKSIANQVAIAVRNARQFEDAQNKAIQETFIVAINQKLQDKTTVSAILETVALELGIYFGFSKAHVMVTCSFNNGSKSQEYGCIFTNNLISQYQPNKPLAESGLTVRHKIQLNEKDTGEIMVTGLETVDGHIRELVSRVGNLLSLRIENIRLNEQTQHALEETDALYNIISDLNSAKDYDEILSILDNRTILNTVDQSLVMFFYDKPLSPISTPEWVLPVASKMTGKENLAQRYPLSAFEIEPNTLFTKTTVVIEDVRTDSRLDRLSARLFLDVFQASSSIILPLLIGDQSLGFIMGNFSMSRLFNETDILRLSTIANQVAASVQGMRMLEQTLNRARRERLLREITSQVNNASGTDGILRRATEQIGKALNRTVYLYLDSKKIDSGDTDAG